MQKGSPQSSGLSVLLQLEKMARRADTVSSLLFLAVNETIKLIPYRQAFVWSLSKNRIEAVSGSPAFEKNTPYIRWALKLSRILNKQGKAEPYVVSREDIPEKLLSGWDEWLPENLLWIPLSNVGKSKSGAMVLARNEEWTDSDITLVSFLAETYGHAWDALENQRRDGFSWRFKSVGRSWGVLLLVLALFAGSVFVKVPLTALGQAEVAALDPAVIRSPLDGVIDEVLVDPNADVLKDQLLVKLDKQNLESQLLQAEKSRDVEKVKLLKATQTAFGSMEFSGQIDILRATIKEREVEVAYIKDLMKRADIKAPFEGVAIFEDKTELVGRPVKTGERILSIARKGQSKLVVWLSTQDAISLEPGAKIRMFLNVDPENPVEATLIRAAFIPSPRPEGYMAYRVEAEFDDKQNVPRVGLRGVAKIYGQEVSFAYYLLRRPYTAIRQWSGF